MEFNIKISQGNKQMKYSTFIPMSDEDEDELNNRMRVEYIKNYANMKKWTLLKSDYFGTDSYYYDNTQNIMYKVSNRFGILGNTLEPIFVVCEDPHILELNNIIA